MRSVEAGTLPIPGIDHLVRDIPKEGVRAVILFGSQALGTAGPRSDLDLCIITERALPQGTRDLLKSYSSRTIHISLYDELPPGVQYRVFRDGILLFGAQDLFLHRTRVAALRSYLNVRPLIERHIRKALG